MLKREPVKLLVNWLLPFILVIISHHARALPVASFTADRTNGCNPLSVQFTSTSTGAVSYYWDLGNGNSSTLANPSNLFTAPGNYTIRLIASDGNGNSDTATLINYIHVDGRPTADFYSNVTSACPDNNSFQFTNTSSGGATNYLWDFGDGTTSSDVNPIHSYSYAGFFTVTLIAMNGNGCQDDQIFNQYITIHPKPDATITVSDTTSCDPETIFQFSNTSSDATSWYWYFGDLVSSSLRNPTHVYHNQGLYQVFLVTANSFGCKDTSEKKPLIQTGFTNHGDFSQDVTSGCAPFAVQFYNNNLGVTSGLWDFGDGNTGVGVVPLHTYTSEGTFTVTYITTSYLGCTDTIIKSNLITVGTTPTVNFSNSNSNGCAPLSVSFTNNSQNFDSCLWTFGDGSTSNAINPVHSYPIAGNYSVTLQCWGSNGCEESITKTNLITTTSPNAIVNGTNRIGCPPLQTSFNSISQSGTLSCNWSFGDGATSTSTNPTHTYSQSGTFDVTLVITDSIGCTDTIVKQGYVQTVNTAANYVPPPVTTGCAPVTAQFSDATFGSNSWLWDFGDGFTSTIQNPAHTYSTPGTHVISLTMTSSGNGCSQTISNYSTYNILGGYAGFSHTDSPCPPYISTFQDTSLNAVSWLWNFGDGTTDTTQNPTHEYTSPGYHSVSLKITTADSCTYTVLQNNIVYFHPFGANFYGITLDSIFPARVQFMANSVGATSWLWDFGDGTGSTLENPLHTFPVFAPYAVTLTISNGACTLFYDPSPFIFGGPDTTPVDTGHGPVYQVQEGCIPFNVLFTNTVNNAVSWRWDFGDGDTSNVEYPTHTYDMPGIFTVVLTATDSAGNSQVMQMDTMIHALGPVAGFSLLQSSTCNSINVQISDSSVNANKWLWDFGDGTIDTTQNPAHIFVLGQSNYTITQTLTDTTGCTASFSTSIFSNSTNPLLASENEVCGYDTVSFFTSLQNNGTYLWNFGDGNTSSAMNPSHVYTAQGNYHVSLTSTDSTGCVKTYYINPDVKVNNPVANFITAGSLQGCDELNVDFNNISTNADTYLWTFGDGNSSPLPNPSHLYNQVGVYDVTLTAYNGACSTTKNYQQYIRVDTAHAEFGFVSNQICPQFITTFTDLSTNPVSWHWDFGDGDTSNLQSPVHTYSLPPVTDPSLVMTDIHGCTDSVTSGFFPTLYAKFEASADSGCYPFTVQFYNYSSITTADWQWDFGDGTTSNLTNPIHTYNQPGIYDVRLIVNSPYWAPNCSDTLVMPAKIKVRKPHTDFTTSNLEACAPSLVNFTNLSTDGDNLLWDFGDGTTSTNVNPSHIYNTPGDYTVKLVTSSNLGCSDSITRPQYIKVLGPTTNFTASATVGCSPFIVTLTDHSVNSVGYSWNFGDGNSDNSLNPVHVFNDTGSFIISLVTMDTSGCTSYYELPQPVIVLPSPVSGFSVSDIAGCEPFDVSFINVSTGNISSLWYFGDGDTTTANDPAHEFLHAGNYNVQLITYNQIGCTDTADAGSPLEVYSSPVPQFTVTDAVGCIPFHVTFVNQSMNLSGAQFLWDFGNGFTSTDENPSFDFMSQGAYTISLTITNSNGCSQTSSYPSLLHVPDSLSPAETNILSVSVESNTSVKIIWENNPAPDLYSYIIYRSTGTSNSYSPIHTFLVNQSNNSFPTYEYVNNGLNTLVNTYSYKVQAVDTCGNGIPLDQIQEHTTINISSAPTGNDIRVHWTPYGGCPITNYVLYRASPGEAFSQIAILPSTTLSFIDSVFTCPWAYAYKVMATDLCGNIYTSYSDTSVTRPFNILAGQVVDVVRSTVVENVSVLTEWIHPEVHPDMVVQYDIYRSTDSANFYFLESVSPLQTDYMDYNVDVQNEHYYYKILVKNSCDMQEDLSGISSTILLQGDMDENRIIHLNWSPYEGWENGVQYYIIEKADENGNWQLLKQVDGNILKYDYQD
jgi:PKD repeat protein